MSGRRHLRVIAGDIGDGQREVEFQPLTNPGREVPVETPAPATEPVTQPTVTPEREPVPA